MDSRLIQDDEGYVIRVRDLYHRTNLEAARAILRDRTFVSVCQDREAAYFTNRDAGAHSQQYGDAIVRVEVPTSAALEDERYHDGETFYRVPLTETAGRTMNAFTITQDGTRVPLEMQRRGEIS